MSHMLGSLAPVGSKVILKPESDTIEFTSGYAGYSAKFVNSGTAALAEALATARKLRPDRSEVILPGYACPDLVSAAVYAGLKPVLVDIEPDSHYLAQDQLSLLLERESVLAVVAVNFLGIPDKLESLAELCVSNGIFLVEDNAQAFPVPGETLYGDFVITSFGRGKPVSLLGGGMLLSKEKHNANSEALTTSQSNGAINYRIKAEIYNKIIFSPFYGVIEKLPFLKVGETRFKSLERVERMPAHIYSRLDTNVCAYLSRNLGVQTAISESLGSSCKNICNLPVQAGINLRGRRLLRYPILACSAEARDEALARLNGQGLGATAMYQQVLPDIPGVMPHLKGEVLLPHARQFAQRLITLPVHEGVATKHIQAIQKVFSEI